VRIPHSRKRFFFMLFALLTCSAVSLSQENAAPLSGTAPQAQQILFADDFKHGLSNWSIELEKPGHVEAINGVLDIDVPAGATLWFKTKLQGPLLIEYHAKVIAQGGPNDRVSDLNCFWMATDSRTPDDLFASPRHGSFAEYNSLLTYYVGLGGNGNTTTRFRRYIGSAKDRPLLPQNDLSDASNLITPNRADLIQLFAQDNSIYYSRNSQRIFHYQDAQPYTSGWFALRTTKNHMQITDFKVYRLR